MIAVDIDNSKFPEEIKVKAKEYCDTKLAHSYADTREELEEDVMAAWLDGFAFCLEGKVNVTLRNMQGDWVVPDKEPL